MHVHIHFIFFRLKAIKKQMGHVVAENDEEQAALSDLNKDLLRRNEQLVQVYTQIEISPRTVTLF